MARFQAQLEEAFSVAKLAEQLREAVQGRTQGLVVLGGSRTEKRKHNITEWRKEGQRSCVRTRRLRSQGSRCEKRLGLARLLAAKASSVLNGEPKR